MDNLKKINKILFITLFVFSIGVFGSYSKTTSKYVIDEYDNIVNKTDFKILTNTVETSSEFKDNTAIFDFTFYRTAITNGEKIKEDTIEISFEGASINKCKVKDDGIEGFASKNGTNSYNKTNKGVKFTYKDTESNTTANKAVKVTYECEVDDSILTEDERVKTRFIGVEKIKLNDGTEENFQIFRKTAVTVDKYVEPTPNDPIYLDNYKKLQFIDKTLTSTLLREWISKYVETYYKDATYDISLGTYENLLYNYIEFNTTSWNPNNVKGLSYDSTTKTYSFDDNIINYASTKAAANNNPNQPSRLYFIKPAGREFSASEIDNMFKEYYYTYYSESTPTLEDEEIFNYVTNKGGISSIITGNNSIIGVNYDSRFKIITLKEGDIKLILHPVTPIKLLSTDDTYVSNILTILNIAAENINVYVKNHLNINDFDKNIIIENKYLEDCISDLPGQKNPNLYYYVSLGNNQYLSLHIYSDENNYLMDVNAFNTYLLEINAEKHAFVSTDTLYKQKTTTSNDYDSLRSEFIKYIKALDTTYGTSFESDGAISKLNEAINTVINTIAADKTSGRIPGKEFKESTKGASIFVRYVMRTGKDYASFLFDFDPNSITTTATTNTVTTNTTKTTSTTKSVPTTLTTTVKTTTKEYTDNKVESKVTGSNE